MTRRNWIITSIVSVVVAALTVFSGIAIANMTAHSRDPQAETEETVRPDETMADTEATTDAPAVPNTIHVLSDEDLNKLASDYSSEIRFYSISNARAENGDPPDAVSYEAEFGDKFGDHIRIRNSENKIALQFLLTEEFESNTDYLLNYLKEKKVQAVFYTTAGYAKANPDVIRRVLTEGHELGAMIYGTEAGTFASLPLSEQQKMLSSLHALVYDGFQYSMNRFFYGDSAFSDASLATVIAMGYDVDFYTINYDDGDHATVIMGQPFLEDMKMRLHPRAVYAFHTVNTASLLVANNLIEYIFETNGEIGLLR